MSLRTLYNHWLSPQRWLDRAGVGTPTRIAFAPMPQYATWRDWWSQTETRLKLFILAGSFVLFWFYLSRMLTMLDPSSVIPGRMQLLMDTLVEGMVILDENERIVMANQS